MSTPFSQPSQSTQLRNPSIDLSSDLGQKIYISALERRCLFLTTRDTQLRSVCELATGRPYDSFDPSELTYDQLMEHEAEDMTQGLNISLARAMEIVAPHRQSSSPSQVEKVGDGGSALPSNYETSPRAFNEKSAGSSELP